jgi:hypothetical protein
MKKSFLNAVKNVLGMPAKVAHNASEAIKKGVAVSEEIGHEQRELERRTRALDLLLDPKARLSGPQRRQLMRQTETTYITGRSQKLVADKVTRKLLRIPMAKLAKLPGKFSRRLRRVESQIEKAGTSRTKALLEPTRNALKLWKAALLDVIEFRTTKFNPHA